MLRRGRLARSSASPPLRASRRVRLMGGPFLARLGPSFGACFRLCRSSMVAHIPGLLLVVIGICDTVLRCS